MITDFLIVLFALECRLCIGANEKVVNYGDFDDSNEREFLLSISAGEMTSSENSKSRIKLKPLKKKRN